MSIQKCPKCFGRKKYLGLGMISHNCAQCDGIGFIKKEDDLEIDSVPVVLDTHKKRGRSRNLAWQK